MHPYRVKNFVNFGPVTPEKTGLICEVLYYMAKKLAYLVEYLRIYWTDFFTVFSPYEALWVQIIDLYLGFQFIKGRCHSNQLILRKCHIGRLIPLAFFALSLKNELQYHCLHVRINSGDDVATSCKNLVNFCLVTPEIMELICVPRYLYLAKIDLHICIRRAAIQKRHEALERWWAH